LPGLILNIVLNFIFIPKFGIIAAALSSLLAYTLTFILYWRNLQPYKKVGIGTILIPTKDDIIILIGYIKNFLNPKKYE